MALRDPVRRVLLKFLGEPILLYQFRSAPFSDWRLAGAGFLRDSCTEIFEERTISANRGRWFFPGFSARIVVPYLKRSFGHGLETISK